MPPATSKPRPHRWLSLPQLLERLLADPVQGAKLVGKARKRQLEFVRRLVPRTERRNSIHLKKKVGTRWYVSTTALETLLPDNVASASKLERDVENLHERHRGLERRVNGHGSKLRDLTRRIEELEQNYAVLLRSIGKARLK